MGLDFSHCDARWGYIGFMRFREKLYHGAGYSGDLREAFESGAVYKMKNDDLYLFINHSDCDGELSPDEMRKILPRMESIVANWPDDDRDKQQAHELMNGMRAAIDANEPLEFQ